MSSVSSHDSSEPDSRQDEPRMILRIVSPNFCIPEFKFPHLAVSTTVSQLRYKIKFALWGMPGLENERFIYRGALVREDATMEDIFGPDVFTSSEPHTIHMVVSDSANEGSTSTPGRTAAPVPQLRARREPRVVYAPLESQNSDSPQFPTGYESSDDERLGTQSSAAQNRDRLARAILSQNQRARAEMGMHGVGDDLSSRYSATSLSRDRSSSRGRYPRIPQLPPRITQRYIDRHARQRSPDSEASSTGLEYRNNDPISEQSLHTSPNIDATSRLDALLRRGRDEGTGRAAVSSSMQRSVSGASLGGRPLSQPGVTFPAASGLSRPLSGRATPDLTPRSMPQSMQPGQNAELYVLSSAEGPQYLLLSPATQELYLTSRRSQTNLSALPTERSTAAPPWLAGIREHARQLTSPRTGTPYQTQHQQQDQQQLQGVAQPQPADLQPPAANLHPNNPLGGAFPALLAHILPHIWSLVQLGFFVWLFTASSSSWIRVVLIVSLAVAVFVFNTGWLNEPLQRIWQPLGRHLDDIFPAIDRRHGIPRPGAANVDAIAALPNQEPDPAQLAARMVAERRAQESWFAGQLRRLERAGLLFLASFAPGVAERHIANLEAEARAEETRRREAEAAAAAAAAAEEQAAAENEDEEEEEDDEDEDSDADESSDEAELVDGTGLSTARSNGRTQDGLRERRQPTMQPA